ncbi:MAG: NAD(P)-dependent oxidoreductase [Microbacteriaceae bacterium]
MTEISFIGLGTMGKAMARRLVDAGHTVRVWNRTQSAADDLVAAGAVRADTIEDALSSAIIFSILSNDKAVQAVFSAEALKAARPGAIHVNMASLSVDAADAMARAHAEAGLAYVAAPVFGRAQVAEVGKLNIVVAGDQSAIERVQPLLDVLGKRTWNLGTEVRHANLVKIGVNYNLIHALQALGESVTLIERGGVDPNTFIEVLTDAAFTGAAYTGYGALIANRRYEPVGFSVALGLKDLSLTEAAAASEGVVLPTAPVLREVFEQALARDDIAELDWSAIAEVTRSLAAPAEANDRS